MAEYPIIFSGPMVRAILDGQKTITRRICKKAHNGFSLAGAVYPARERGWISWWPGNHAGLAEFTKKQYREGWSCPYGSVGDTLWVRETWTMDPNDYGYPQEQWRNFVAYRADDPEQKVTHWGWRPSIHMPRWACRLRLRITSVRPERLQDITENDAEAEGVDYLPAAPAALDHRTAFAGLWDSLNAKRGHPWSDNPWVWVIGFSVCEQEMQDENQIQ